MNINYNLPSVNYHPDRRITKPVRLQKGGKSDLFRTDKTAYVDSVLNANKNIDWVKRLFETNTSSMISPFDSNDRSTHLMGDNGEGYVFPTIVREGNSLRLIKKGAEDYARKTNTGIQFPKEQGTWFARNGYKQGTNVLKEYKKGGLTKAKAKEILHDGSIRNHGLTPKQKRFFGWKAYGKNKQFGGKILKPTLKSIKY